MLCRAAERPIADTPYRAAERSIAHTIGHMAARRRGFQLAKVFGVPVSVGASWFIALFLYIILIEPYIRSMLPGSGGSAYLITVVSVLTFFLSLLLHELGHALVAKRDGQQVAGIELWALGGITRTVGASKTPGAQFRVAVAGPLVTAAVVGLCALGGILLAPHQQFFHFDVAAGVHTTPIGVLLKLLAMLNVFVLGLNLVPAFPLDGGQIVQAVVWAGTKDQNKATRIAGRLGQAFALALAGGGLYLLAHSNSELGIYLLIVALIVYQGAGAAVVQGSISQRLQQLTVADVMDTEPITVPADATLLDARERYFTRYQWPWLAVVDPSKHFLGVLTRERIEAEIAAGRPALIATDALEDSGIGIGETQPLESLLRSEALSRFGGMVAVDAEGTLRGVVTLAQVRQALRPAS